MRCRSRIRSKIGPDPQHWLRYELPHLPWNKNEVHEWPWYLLSRVRIYRTQFSTGCFNFSKSQSSDIFCLVTIITASERLELVIFGSPAAFCKKIGNCASARFSLREIRELGFKMLFYGQIMTSIPNFFKNSFSYGILSIEYILAVLWIRFWPVLWIFPRCHVPIRPYLYIDIFKITENFDKFRE
jgi:hypothetical protein